jgi:hypothetical protein
MAMAANGMSGIEVACDYSWLDWRLASAMDRLFTCKNFLMSKNSEHKDSVAAFVSAFSPTLDGKNREFINAK